MRLFRVEIEILRLEKLHINGKNVIFYAYFLENIWLSSENVVNLHVFNNLVF